MSRGSILQMGALGSHDVNLIGKPEISFFRTVYKRHTYFANNYHYNSFDGEPELGQTHKIIIDKLGDLIGNMYLKLEIKIQEEDGIDYSLVNNLGYNIIDFVELQIGQNKITKLYGRWMDISNQYYKQSGNDSYLKTIIDAPYNLLNMTTGTDKIYTFELLIPLNFWFCKYSNVPLPIVSLQHEEISLNVKFNKADELINVGYIHNNKISSTMLPKLESGKCKLVTNNFFLHNEERKYFVDNEFKYLIEQVQYDSYNISETNKETENKINIYFNQPIKSLFWVISQNRYENLDNKPNYLATTDITSINKNFINEQFFHFLLDLIISSKDALDVLNVDKINILYIDTNGQLLVIDKQTRTTQITTGNKFNLNYEITNQHNIKNSINVLNNALKKIEIYSNGLEVYQLNIEKNFYMTGDFSYHEKILINNLINISVEDLGSKKNNYLFDTHIKLSDNSVKVSTNLKRFVNHNKFIYSLYPGSEVNPTNKSQLFFSNLPKSDILLGSHFNVIEPMRCKTSIPSIGVNMFSFSIKPFEYQPMGHVNFSKLDSVILNVTQNKLVKDGILHIYALNYNTLAVKSGVSSLLYTS